MNEKSERVEWRNAAICKKSIFDVDIMTKDVCTECKVKWLMQERDS